MGSLEEFAASLRQLLVSAEQHVATRDKLELGSSKQDLAFLVATFTTADRVIEFTGKAQLRYFHNGYWQDVGGQADTIVYGHSSNAQTSGKDGWLACGGDRHVHINRSAEQFCELRKLGACGV